MQKRKELRAKPASLQEEEGAASRAGGETSPPTGWAGRAAAGSRLGSLGATLAPKVLGDETHFHLLPLWKEPIRHEAI